MTLIIWKAPRSSFWFCVFKDLDLVSVHKNAKRELGQYPAILTKLAWSIKYTYCWLLTIWNVLLSPVQLQSGRKYFVPFFLFFKFVLLYFVHYALATCSPWLPIFLCENTTWSVHIHSFTVTMHYKEDDDDYHNDGMCQAFLDDDKCSFQWNRNKSP